MSVGYYKVDLSYTGYNLDGTVAVYGSGAPVDLQGKPIINFPQYGSAIALGGGAFPHGGAPVRRNPGRIGQGGQIGQGRGVQGQQSDHWRLGCDQPCPP